MTGVRCVIFDMDGVLCHYDFRLRLAIMAEALDLTPDFIAQRIYASGFDNEADEGRVSADDYLPLVGERLGCEVPLPLWLEARRSAITANADMLRLARALNERLTVAMLTNNNMLLQRHFAEVFPEAAALFGDRAFFSAQFGTGKDWPDVFPKVLERLGHAPRDTLFIDDSASYIANASTAGLQTHRFTGAAELRAALQQLNLP